ncbi:MAG: CRISPR-associated endonuclease Cas2 [Betaproteobacteria bacterium CG2_30_68_42]|nr:MAG: CRISPR-associated endonuclease Cas2 [Betaproteobacteria bacterium CG2_30_68_42]
MTTSRFEQRWFEFGPDAWLIAYDIADPMRLARVHRYLKAVAMPVQYSVFLGWFSPREIDLLTRGLETRIDARRDDVRMYHLPSRTQLYRFGRQWLPERVFLVGDTWHIGEEQAIGSNATENPGDRLRNHLSDQRQSERED